MLKPRAKVKFDVGVLIDAGSRVVLAPVYAGVIQGLVLELKACQCVLENSLKSSISP